MGEMQQGAEACEECQEHMSLGDKHDGRAEAEPPQRAQSQEALRKDIAADMFSSYMQEEGGKWGGVRQAKGSPARALRLVSD